MITEEKKNSCRPPDVFKPPPHDELVRRAEAVSKHLLKKNKKAYEDLANK